MSERRSLPESIRRRLHARPAFLVAGVLALVAAAWLALRPDPEELKEIVTVDAAGDTIVYSGPVRDAVARARIVEAFNSVAATVEDSAPEAAKGAEADSTRRAGEAARAARQAALDALARLYAEPVDPEAVVRALNLAVIDFADGAADLPPDAAGFIQAAAEVIERAPDAASFLVAGYARGGADAAADLAVSQSRADAVVDALAEAGADGDRLRAEGYGSGSPGAEEGVVGEVEVADDRQIVFRLIEVVEPAEEDADAVETEDETNAAGGDSTAVDADSTATDVDSAAADADSAAADDQPEAASGPAADDEPDVTAEDAPDDGSD